MALFFSSHIWKFWRSNSRFCLAFVWIFGLVSGAVCSGFSVDYFLWQLPAVFSVSQTVIPLLASWFLWLMLSASIVYSGLMYLLLPLAFGKGFLHAFLGCCVLHVCGSSGWLIHILLQFGECASLPVLWFFWTRGIRRGKEGLGAAVFFAVCLIFLTLSFDYSVISPFLTNILSL